MIVKGMFVTRAGGNPILASEAREHRTIPKSGAISVYTHFKKKYMDQSRAVYTTRNWSTYLSVIVEEYFFEITKTLL